MASPKISLLHTSAMVGIVFVHLALLYFLYYFQPKAGMPIYATMQKSQDQITQIVFITRPKKISVPNTASKKINREPQAETLQVEFKKKNADAAPENVASAMDTAPLNLSPPEPSYDFSAKPRDILERQRNTVDYQSTRFNSSYKPSGNAVDSLKWKSKTFNFITGMFGGNIKICTDEDRKNRLPECVPDAYKPEE